VPDTLTSLLVVVFVCSYTALFSLHPLSVVLTTVLPDEFTLSVALIFFELADVLLLVGPSKVTLAMHFVV
jgi:hypothetical protein